MEIETIKDLIHSKLAPNGFKRKGSTWYLQCEELVGLINVQRSAFGKQFYLNLAWWLKCLNENEHPKEPECHIRIRVTEIFPNRRSFLNQLFDLENLDISDEERAIELSKTLDQHIIPFIMSNRNMDSLKCTIALPEFHNAAITIQARGVLALPELTN